MSSKDKKEKKDKGETDKKDKSDKKEKSDKKDKADKKDKGDAKDKKDKTDKKEKVDTKDKKDKSDKKDKVDTKDKKDKSDKKEKVDTKDKKGDTSEKKSTTTKDTKRTASDEDVKVIGATTYNRVKVKEDKATKTKAGMLWVPEGKNPSDKAFVWQEVSTPNGEVNYVLLADPDNVKYELPDIGGAPQDVVLERKKFEEKKEWKDEAAKKLVTNAVKKALAAEPRFAELSKDDQGTMTSNIAKEFMSVHKKLDVISEGWIQDTCQSQISDFLNAKKSAQKAHDRALAAITAVQLKPTENLSGDLQSESQLPLPLSPLPAENCLSPASPLLSKATFLRDPYYYRRLNVRSARRGLYESKLEQTSFQRPGAGDIRVLCAVGVKTGKDFAKTLIFAVARDWTGAFAFFQLEPSDTADPVVVGAYPLLDQLEFPPVGFQKVQFSIDNNEFSATFRDQDHATWLHDALKMGMCSMYGQGTDDSRIVHMRANSVEFSASDMSYFPLGSIPDSSVTTRSILNDDRREGEALNVEFGQLRLCLRTPEGREQALRLWCRSIDESSVFRRKSPAMVNNHIRFMSEVLRCPTEHDDRSLYVSVLEHFELLLVDQPDPVRHQINKLKTQWRLVEPLMDSWETRQNQRDVPFDECFEPESGTQADRQEKMLLLQKRAQAASFNNPPGIYLTLLVYCGSQVLCQGGSGALFSEIILPNPTTLDLRRLTQESQDFQWILQLGGANDNWIQETQRWSEMYRTVGKDTFRAKFLHAANRLLHSQPFSTLGFVFDIPVHQPRIGCAHIVTVLRIDNKDRVPMSAGIWRNLSDLEHQLYLQALVATECTRMNFLSSDYYNCRRFVAAALRYRELLDRRLAPGLYFGFLIVQMDAAGPMILVPEANRLLPPMSMVTDLAPTIAQWRWMQGLNERRKRTGTFGLDVPSAAVPAHQLTFEQRFARSVDELQTATGITITQFYDMEISVLDEAQSIRAFFAVHLLRPQEVTFTKASAGSVCLSEAPRPPAGTVPMVLKHAAVLEDNVMRMYWPKVYCPMGDERSALHARAYSTAQPFSIDEVVRLQHECAAGFYCDVDKFCMLISWLRPVITWCATDGRTLIEKHGGDASDVSLRSIEDAVDVSVSNYAASQDVNVITMRSLIYDSASKPHYSWSTLLSQLRERDRVISAGYGSRLVPSEARDGVRQLVLRTQDEIGAGEVADDDDNPRPPTVYEVPCTLIELIFKDADSQQAERYFQMQEIVNSVVEAACIEGVDVGHVKTIGSVVSDMISVIETTEDLVESAALLSLKDDTIAQAWKDREKFQRHWLDVFHHSDGARGTAADRTLQRALSTDDIDDDDDPLAAPLFYDGSQHAITNFVDGVRVCLAKSTNTCEQLQQLLRVCNSAVEGLELVQCIQQYSTCAARRDALVGASESSAATTATAAPGTQNAVAASSRSAGGSGVTIVSREFQEYYVPPVDPLRCLVLHNVVGKVRFPTISSSALEVFAHHLRTPDLAVPQALELLAGSHAEMRGAEELLDMATQLKAPLIMLRLVTALFGTKRGSTTFFELKAAHKLKTLLENSFMFEYGIKDWLHIEVLGGHATAAAMDVMWWIRFLKEAAQSIANGNDPGKSQREDAFTDHESSWKQVYSETRVRVFLTYGVQSLSADEVTLWSEAIGRLVEYMTFRETTLSDSEVEVLVTSCPNLRSLDLSFTQITSRSVQLLTQHSKHLAECSVAGCNLSVADHDALRRHCAENRRRDG